MQLTRYTDYAFRLLIYLATLPPHRRASIDEISERHGISRNNVNKIVHQLGREGVIETRRGKGGGIQLRRDPSDINVGETLRLLEPGLQLVDCQSPPCRIAPACELQRVLAEAMAAFMASLCAYSLADLVGPRKVELLQLLEIREAGGGDSAPG